MAFWPFQAEAAPSEQRVSLDDEPPALCVSDDDENDELPGGELIRRNSVRDWEDKQNLAKREKEQAERDARVAELIAGTQDPSTAAALKEIAEAFKAGDKQADNQLKRIKVLEDELVSLQGVAKRTKKLEQQVADLQAHFAPRKAHFAPEEEGSSDQKAPAKQEVEDARTTAAQKVLAETGQEDAEAEVARDPDDEEDEADGDDNNLQHSSTTAILPAKKKMVDPIMLDFGDMYQAQESVWDSMIFFGHDSIGFLNSAVLGSIWFLNLALQATFIYIIETLMMEPLISPEILDGLLKFRLGLAHRAEFADKVTQRSMAAQICAGERKLHMAGEQVGLYKDLVDFVEGGATAQILALFIQYTWLCTILKDIDNTYSIFAAVRKIKHSKRRTRLVLTDLLDEDDEQDDVVKVSQHRRSSREDDDDQDEDDLIGFMKVVKMCTITQGRLYFIYFFVCMPKVLLACMLHWTGARWLANTISFEDLILNGVALAFVLEFDEVIYSVFMPRRTKTLINNLEPLPVRRRTPGSRWNGITTVIMGVVIMIVMGAVYWCYMKPVWWMINQGEQIVCSGDVDFIYTLNPATKMVHVSQTTGEDEFTDTEEIIAQVAQVSLMADDGWEGLVGDNIFAAATSSFERAVKETSVDSFNQIVQMSVWSLADAASTLPCRDLASGRSVEASLVTLRLHAEDPSITSCSDIPPDKCADPENTWLRAICPRHCRCEETLLRTNVGFFGEASFGCPTQCETFKAAMSEIFFRFDLSKVDSGAADSGDAGRRLEGPGVGGGCADIGADEFAFLGGCADSNGERQLDKMGNDCTVYTLEPSRCGSDDDDDFQASEVCCACGGGRQDVSSTITCFEKFEESCWHLPPKALAWLLYVRGLFQYSMSKPGFQDSVANVVKEDYAGIAISEDMQNALIEHISSGAMGRALANGSWDLMPGLPHPRGLTGCAFLTSYEITSLLNLDLCAEGIHTPVRFFCPRSCGCDGSNGLHECPAACVLRQCTGAEGQALCAHVHPWFSEECIAGWHNDGGKPTCFKCTDGETRRRRSTSCTECADGHWDEGNKDNCTQCTEGTTRRRRSVACTDCDPGFYDDSDNDDCSACIGGDTRRRRATNCTDCADGTYNVGGRDECVPCSGCETTRRRSSACQGCAPGFYNDGSTDDCARCEGGHTRRRRSTDCTPCGPGTKDEGDYDDCFDVECPVNSYSERGGVPSGCVCDLGFVGQIRPTTKAPYFSGVCSKYPYHTKTWGRCDMAEILDYDECEIAVEELQVEGHGIQEVNDGYTPNGCVAAHGQLYFNDLNGISPVLCTQYNICLCYGSADDFKCVDDNSTLNSDGKSDCLTLNEHTCPGINFGGTNDPLKDGCCICGGGTTVRTFPSLAACSDTAGEALSKYHTDCLKWDWFPETCKWSYYYDDDDFSALDMCCSCGGGERWTVTESSTTSATITATSVTTQTSTTSEHTTTASSTTAHTTTITARTRPYDRMDFGEFHGVALIADGTVVSWGAGWNGQLGTNDYSTRAFPTGVAVGGTAVYAGSCHSAYINEAGTLHTTGCNGDGQLGDMVLDGRKEFQAVKSDVLAAQLGGQHTLLLLENGDVLFAGSMAGHRVQPWYLVFTGASRIASGQDHAAVLKPDGTLWTAGSGGSGRLGDASDYDRGTFQQVLSNIQAVALGSQHSAAIRSDGAVLTAGKNNYGQLGDGEKTTRYTFEEVFPGYAQAIALGKDHTAVLKSDGTVYVAGSNVYGQLGNAVPAHHLDVTDFVEVATGVQAVWLGDGTTALLRENGVYSTVGMGSDGQLADGRVADRNQFMDVASIYLGPLLHSTCDAGEFFAAWGFCEACADCCQGYHASGYDGTCTPCGFDCDD